MLCGNGNIVGWVTFTDMEVTEIMKGKMNGKPTRGRRRLQISLLHDMTKGDHYATLQ